MPVIPSMTFDHFSLTPDTKCESNCCLWMAPDKIHEVLKGQVHNFDIKLEGREYILVNVDREIIFSSDTFSGTKPGIHNLIHRKVTDIFEKHESLFWNALIDLAIQSKGCIELRAAESGSIHKIILKSIWNENPAEVYGVLITRFPYSNISRSSSQGTLQDA